MTLRLTPRGFFAALLPAALTGGYLLGQLTIPNEIELDFKPLVPHAVIQYEDDSIRWSDGTVTCPDGGLCDDSGEDS